MSNLLTTGSIASADFPRKSVLPQFSDSQAADWANKLFDLFGTVTRLNGERDLNFLIEDKRGPIVFKISCRNEDISMLNCQHEVFEILNESIGKNTASQSILSLNGNITELIESSEKTTHYCRAVTFIPGPMYADVNPRTSDLMESVGTTVAKLNEALIDYDHPALQRPLLWKMENAVDVVDRFKHLITDPVRNEIVSTIQKRFADCVLPIAGQLPKTAIHNDVNDLNIVVSRSKSGNCAVKAIIDFGDMVRSWRVVDLAVAATYILLDESHPLDAAGSVVKGYHRQLPLSELEIGLLFDLINMRLTLSVCIGAYQQAEDPENKYLGVSEKSIWNALFKFQKTSPAFAHYYFRDICGLEPVPNCLQAIAWIRNRQSSFSSIVDIDLAQDKLLILDSSVGSATMPNPLVPYDPHEESKRMFRILDDSRSAAAIGKYDEYRLIYSSDDFIDATGYRRTLHLGIDIFMASGTPVYAPLAGKVFGVANNDATFDYGGTVILQHQYKDKEGEGCFYTLYGHLSPESVLVLKTGAEIPPGQLIGKMGEPHENGNWIPHVHFGIITDMLGQTETFVGVGAHQHRQVWLSLCPDPNLILGIPDELLGQPNNDADAISHRIHDQRKRSLNPSLSLSYKTPIHMVRGAMQYLYDYTGRCYLDSVNNVPHVGHCHPTVVAAQNSQAAVLSTNTRYLYSSIEKYSSRLLDKFPDQLQICYFVNSGSEANDLALRLAATYTEKRDVVLLDHAYHGNLISLIEVSPYKHDGSGGKGTPPHAHTASLPDIYRASGQNHIEDLKSKLHQAQSGSGLSAFIAESIPGCAGQVVLPDGYLEAAYGYVREQGGVCIADEVQVGFGRVGSHFWAFETQNVVPDIVTLGKPMGNGHPLAAVVTTREIADAFNNGMEYFSTFGGNPVSCAIGEAVLDVIEKENLQENARVVGGEFLLKLHELMKVNSIIGDVRGLGLFIGIELVNDRNSLDPAQNQASYVVERMKQCEILISTDGPFHNVLKIKPPICFDQSNVSFFVSTLDTILKEDMAQPNC